MTIELSLFFIIQHHPAKTHGNRLITFWNYCGNKVGVTDRQTETDKQTERKAEREKRTEREIESERERKTETERQ